MKTIDGLYAVIKGQRVPQGTSLQTKDGLSFTVKRKDAAELERFILGVVKIGTGVAIARTNINGEDCDVKLGIGGGRDGGQGGTDPGNSGVGGGSSSSGGTGGAPGAQ